MKKILLIALLLPVGVVSCTNEKKFDKYTALDILSKRQDELFKEFDSLEARPFTETTRDSMAVNIELSKELLNLRRTIADRSY